MAERHKKKKKASRHAYSKTAAPTDVRVRVPREGEVLGIVDIRLGMGKSRIRCVDGNTRICRVPGAKKRRLWVRPRDVVLVKLWEFGGDGKGDIIFKYRDNQVNWLKKNDYLKDLLEQEEF